MLVDCIRENYGFEVEKITKMSGGWSSNVYLIESNRMKYVLKDVPIHATNHPEDEGRITSYLREKGLMVSELIKTKSGKYIWNAHEKQYHLQKFIEGDTLELNTAPDWFMEKSAQYLGKIHRELSLLEKFPIGMGEDFIKYSSPDDTKQSYLKTLEHAIKMHDHDIIMDLENRLKQIEKLK